VTEIRPIGIDRGGFHSYIGCVGFLHIQSRGPKERVPVSARWKAWKAIGTFDVLQFGDQKSSKTRLQEGSMLIWSGILLLISSYISTVL
jgi:hypothetical protein